MPRRHASLDLRVDILDGQLDMPRAERLQDLFSKLLAVLPQFAKSGGRHGRGRAGEDVHLGGMLAVLGQRGLPDALDTQASIGDALADAGDDADALAGLARAASRPGDGASDDDRCRGPREILVADKAKSCVPLRRVVRRRADDGDGESLV